MKRQRSKRAMAGSKLVLTNFRLARALLAELDEAKRTLGKVSVADVVRDALREFLDRLKAKQAR